MEKITPITPEQVIKEKKIKEIPDCIINAVNELIIENYKHTSKTAEILQNDILDKVKNNFSRKEIFDNCWLDIEDLYRKAGWNVKYYRGAYWDTTPCYFTFKLKEN